MTQSKKPSGKAASAKTETSKQATKKVTAVAAGAPVMKNVTPASDVTERLLREVDEAMHQEKMLEIWHKSKWYLVTVVAAVLLMVAGDQAWKAWNAHKARTMAAQWYAYSELKTDAERAQMLPELLQTTTGGTHALAVFAQARMQHTGAEKAKAYGMLVNDKSAPEWLRDLARLNAAIAIMDEKPDEAKAQLELLAQTNVEELPRPTYAPALELLALMAQKAGDVEAAKGYTRKLLQMGGLPADMRQRSLQRYGVLGGE